VSEVAKHRASIEQRRKVYIAICTCGWRGPRVQVLREAEADAWTHQFGDSRLVVLDAPDAVAYVSVGASLSQAPEAPWVSADDTGVVDRPGVTRELQALAEGSTARLERARSVIVDLLHQHDLASGGAADSQWLELHTAKRVLDAAADWHAASAF